MRPAVLPAAALLVLTASLHAAAQVTPDAPARRPAAVVDLGTDQGATLAQARWRYRDVTIVETGHRAPGPDLRASGPAIRTWDISPRAGDPGFDDGGWTTIPASTLTARRATGRLSFAWYRLDVTIPDRVGPFETAGSTAVLEIVVDDYAEIWVDGRLPQVLGQSGGPLIRGFNAPNRVVLSADVRAGQRFDVAVFAANGPLSSPPANFIWIRSATLDFYRDGRPGTGDPVKTSILQVDPRLAGAIDPGAQAEKLAGGFTFTEGPVWSPDGYLLFSDPNDNTIYRWSPDGQVSVYRTKSGYTGSDIGEYRQPGSNGLAFDGEGRLTIAEHGNRRVTRIEKTGAVTVLADRYNGRRLNSPNDLVYRSDGTLYFTDPPFGLPRVFDDPRKELPFSGVYRVREGRVELLDDELTGPNGIAFSPDEQYLYVGNWDEQKKVVMRYPVRPDGALGPGAVFFDMTTAAGDDAIDGIKVDEAGHVFVSGPGGLWILSPSGEHLGTLVMPEHAHNMAWGDDDYRTLYLAAQTGLYKVRVKHPGARRPDGRT